MNINKITIYKLYIKIYFIMYKTIIKIVIIKIKIGVICLYNKYTILN